MSKKIVFCESNIVKISPAAEKNFQILGEFVKVDCKQNYSALQQVLQSSTPEMVRFILISCELESNIEFCNLLKGKAIANQCLWVGSEVAVAKDGLSVYSRISTEDLENAALLKLVFIAFNWNRSVGIKSFLLEGSTIYTQSFTSTQGMGSALDPCQILIKDKLSKERAAEFWSALNAIVAEALHLLGGKTSEGARVELQCGVDVEVVCASVRFPMDITDMGTLQKAMVFEQGQGITPWTMAREDADYVEARVYEEDKSVEITMAFLLKGSAKSKQRPLVLRRIPKTPLEDPAVVAKYKFQSMNSIGTKKNAANMRFKKKFSEQVQTTTVSGGEEAKNESNLVKGAAPTKEEMNLVKGAASAKESSTHVKGAELEKESVQLVKGLEQSPELKAMLSEIKLVKDPEKRAALYESKIESLQNTLAQREQLVAKLNKEIAEINDPMRRGVVSNVLDTQKEALTQNVHRLEDALKEAEKKEKELVSMADKAIQARDKATKELKALELKLEQASSGNNSLILKLQKQLEEANRQKALLTKKISEIAEKKAS